MFCTNCGQKNNDAAKFCAGCGSPLPEATDNQHTFADNTKLTTPTKKKTNILAIVSLCCAILAWLSTYPTDVISVLVAIPTGIAGIVFVFAKKNSKISLIPAIIGLVLASALIILV